MAPGRVLVVDDDHDVVDAMTALLHVNGFHAKGVYSALRITAEVAEFKPDVIVLDVAMPGRDGWWALRKIRSAGNEKDRPRVIMFSGDYLLAPNHDFVRQTGADHFFVKAGDPSEIMELISRGRISAPDCE